MTKETFFKIFDSKIQSVLMYSSEIWVYTYQAAWKEYISWHVKDIWVYQAVPETKWYIETQVDILFLLPHMFVVLSTGFAYYNRMLVNFDENGKQCWASEVRELLCKTGFYFVWLQQGVGDVKSFL